MFPMPLMAPNHDKASAALPAPPPRPSANGGHRPFLPPETPVQSSPTGLVRPQAGTLSPHSAVHFNVTPELPELRALAASRGWLTNGWDVLGVRWQELHWTADGWQTVHVLRSTDVPCPVVNGFFYLPVTAGTEVEFAVHVGLACRAPQDGAGQRDEADLWFNGGGRNYRQKTR